MAAKPIPHFDQIWIAYLEDARGDGSTFGGNQRVDDTDDFEDLLMSRLLGHFAIDENRLSKGEREAWNDAILEVLGRSHQLRLVEHHFRGSMLTDDGDAQLSKLRKRQLPGQGERPLQNAPINMAHQQETKGSPMKVFISHATHDAALVNAFVDLLRLGINLPSEAIYCTSRGDIALGVKSMGVALSARRAAALPLEFSSLLC